MIIPFVTRVNEEETKKWLKALRLAMPDHTILPLHKLNEAECQSCEVAIVANPDPFELAGLPNLKWVQSLWAGVEGLLAELTDPSIKIVRMIDPQLTKTMAEAVLAWTLYLHRDMPRYHQQQKEKNWQQHEVLLASERTIGILGLGNLGKAATIKLAKQGFTVCGWSRSKVDIDGVTTFAGAGTFETVLKRSDILIVLLPLTDETQQILSTKTLSLLPDKASIINFSRSAIINNDALLGHLDNNKLSHAVLDVFDNEPLPENNPYWDHPSITVLPHISAPTNKKTASVIAAHNLQRYFKNNVIPKSVNRLKGY